MYKILIKYTSTSKGIFWRAYEIKAEDGTSIEFVTDDIEVLKAEINKLDKSIGYKNIRVINDISYDVLVNVDELSLEGFELATYADIDAIFNTAYEDVFGE